MSHNVRIDDFYASYPVFAQLMTALSIIKYTKYQLEIPTISLPVIDVTYVPVFCNIQKKII